MSAPMKMQTTGKFADISIRVPAAHASSPRGTSGTHPGQVTVTLQRDDSTIIFKLVPAEVWGN